jgi:transcriptional regulator with XRE-family HTH domain
VVTTLNELGNRLKKIRKLAKLSQKEVAEKLGQNQNTISRLENGNGGSIDILLSLIAFYSKYIAMDYILSDQFHITGKNKGLNNVAAEKLAIAKADFDKSLQDVFELLSGS